ncbi:hypothetical protein [Hymenobacter rigui]|uniref:Uncharacterized protein n=1 Tax=Hymenobacter rigui TaxID=334424 RepID=A0A3R9MEA0_9BACT|nr:hypothetical protein [Hymenobacter rigui]RSK43854.1 hypothetical protein EI291_21110 [Hymenobacter rigui]
MSIPSTVLAAFFLLGLATSSVAQTVPQHSDLSTARYDRSDTLRAVRYLFMRRSQATRGWLQAGTGLAATAVVEKGMLATTSLRKQDKQYYQSRQQNANGDILLGSLITGYGLLRLSRFGPQQYQRVLNIYLQGGPLPQYLTRRLRPKYFRMMPPV